METRLSQANERCLAFLHDIYEVSGACGTRTYIWGGTAVDILAGRFTREHHDIDGMTLNLLDVRYGLTALYRARGYTVTFLQAFHMMRIERDGLAAAFNRLECNGDTAMWRHIGNDGTVYFPARWLQDTSRPFYDTHAFISGVEFEYAIKTCPALLSPEWAPRDKDIAALAFLGRQLAAQGIDPGAVLSQIWSHNPFWARKGYAECTFPEGREKHPA